ncbi:MAG: tRNA (adenosine(37)-N6)-threonylcarbamoyltransferase complex ATPase subunit type 1 TsaE, partial [Spirochaeta sp.]
MLITAKSFQQTELIGRAIGAAAVGGSTYRLIGELGMGKTVFARGFARGLGIQEPITSPT